MPSVPTRDPQERDGPQHPAQRLVQEQRVEPGRRERKRLARVVGDAVGAVDGDAPWQVGRRAVQLLVEEVPPAPDRLHHEDARRDDVGPAPERLLPAAGQEPRNERAGEDPAVDAEARVRRQDDLEPVVLVQLPLVDDVVQPAADQRRDRDDDDPVVDEARVQAAPARLAGDDDVGGGKPPGIRDAVPEDRERPELECDRVGGDGDQRQDRRKRRQGKGRDRHVGRSVGPVPHGRGPRRRRVSSAAMHAAPPFVSPPRPEPPR